MYNLNKFGEFLRLRREKIKITQKSVADEIGVNLSTIWRIENGYVVPSVETLIKISYLYKTKITNLLEVLYDDPAYAYDKIKIDIEKIILDNNFEKLEELGKHLNDIIAESKSEYYKLTIEQYIFFIKGILNFSQENYFEAKNIFLEALKISNKNFNLNDFDIFNYSELELRILMNIGLTCYQLDEDEMYKRLIKFCYEMMFDCNSDSIIKTKYNYAVLLYREKEYKKSLEETSNTILFSQKIKYFHLLPTLLYHKSLCYYKLRELDNYESTLVSAKIISENFGMHRLLKRIEENLKKHNINIPE